MRAGGTKEIINPVRPTHMSSLWLRCAAAVRTKEMMQPCLIYLHVIYFSAGLKRRSTLSTAPTYCLF